MRSFDRITTSGLKPDTIWIQRTRIPIKTRSFRERDTTFGNFRDDNVCAGKKYINSNSGREFVAGNGFSDRDFL